MKKMYYRKDSWVTECEECGKQVEAFIDYADDIKRDEEGRIVSAAYFSKYNCENCGHIAFNVEVPENVADALHLNLKL